MKKFRFLLVCLTLAGVLSGCTLLYPNWGKPTDSPTCTATFNGGGKTVKASTTAESNASNTQCKPIEIPLGGLPRGAGVVTVSYESKNYYGTSQSVAVTIE